MSYEEARLKFREVVALIDRETHPDAHRIAWLLPLWVYQRMVTAENIAKDIVENAAFWHWVLTIANPPHDIELLRTMFAAMDVEDTRL